MQTVADSNYVGLLCLPLTVLAFFRRGYALKAFLAFDLSFLISERHCDQRF